MKEEKRCFWLGLGLGLFILLTTAGLFTVDYQGRKLSFGDSTPLAQVERSASRAQLTVKALGQKRTWDVTALDKAWRFILDFSCMPGGSVE